MNSTTIYVSIGIVFIVLWIAIKWSVFWELTKNQQKDLDKKVLIEMNLPTIKIDEQKLEKINSQKNIKLLNNSTWKK